MSGQLDILLCQPCGAVSRYGWVPGKGVKVNRDLRIIAAPNNPHPPFAVLEELVSDLKALLDDVSRMAEDRPSEWQITRLALHSIDLAVAPAQDSDRGERTIDAIINGFAMLSERVERPPFFTSRTLGSARRIANIGERYGLTIIRGETELPISASVTQHVGRLLSARRHTFGSIIGRLEAISVHGGFRFSLYPTYGTKIECSVDEALLRDAVELLGARVLVEGIVYENAVGDVTKVQARELLAFRPPASLPKVSQLVGLFEGMTDGLPAAEWLRRTWDGNETQQHMSGWENP